MKKPGKRVRLSDLAAYCGVSPSTASRALSGTPGVRPDLRKKILDAAQIKNYHMPLSISGMKVILVASIAAMIDYHRHQFTTYVLEGLQERAETLGVELITCSVTGPEEELKILDKAKADEQVAGLLFLTIDDDAMLAPTRTLAKPVVLINGDDPAMVLSSVAPHNRGAASVSTKYLRSLGHERILLVTNRGRRTIERRLEGWRDELSEACKASWRDWVVNVGDWTPEAAKRSLLEYIGERGVDFTAILCAGDSLAIGVVLALKECGIGIPEDVSVLGIDGLPQGSILTPPLTVVQIPMRQIGAAALDMLREQFLSDSYVPRRIELSCQLVERGSTAPARATSAAS